MKRLCIILLLSLSITTNAQQITKAEYFFNTDPGIGNGTPVTISTPADTVNFTANIPVAGLPAGFHWLGIRTQNAAGVWGFFDRRNFYITRTTVDMTGITGAEYFYDQDPGPGNGTAIALNSPGN